MTTIFIKDTGYIKPGEESGSQYSGATNIVNGGDELPLKGVSIRYQRGVSFDDTPQPGTFEDTRLNFVSINNPVVVISGRIYGKGDMSLTSNTINQISGVSSITDQDGNASKYEVDILFLLDLLCKTRGYKELYYKDGTENENILYGIGETDTYNPTYRHLHVRVKGINITQNATNKMINWHMTCQIEKGEST